VTDRASPASAPQGDAVRAWSDRVVIPTYPVIPPERCPIFVERRVYQGSSGRVYPNPVIERVSDQKVDRAYDAVHLENQYIRLMILPEIGGRIHVGQDVTNGYDFFYRQRVIKPALVGLLGPWISGGVEFNWPQHHRPSTFMPVDWAIEEAEDGSRTVWLSEHEPMGRMKGSVGVTLHPGRSLVEVRARLYNRTPFVQTFLWWANVAVRVHDQYEVFFPQDVWHVADHAKRAMATFPIARHPYYGVDYGQGPGGGTDIRWYRNIPVPTSYMAMGSHHDFFGGYDHAAEAGLVHVADHRIAPGKKLWTWGDHEFGHAWDRNLTDEDGPYVELMAGVYTDNQPDFSFLQPYETRTFVERWYPIQRIGPPTLANDDVAVRLGVDAGRGRVGVAVTGLFPGAIVRLERASELLIERRADLAPDAPLLFEVSLPSGTVAAELRLRVTASDGRALVDHVPETPDPGPLPAPASEPPVPADIATVEELYLTGLHLEQYRHATRSPEPYWREALRRDPADARTHTALGAWCLRRGEPALAERHLRAAIARLTRRNPNPGDGEPFYLLGVAFRLLGRDDEARDAFFKATWNQAWASAGHHAIAELDATRREWGAVMEHAGQALRTNADDLKARDLRAAALRHLGRPEQALEEAEATLALDRLDLWAAFERAWASRALGLEVPDPAVGDLQTHLDVGLDLAAAGLWNDAIAVVEAAAGSERGAQVDPLALYHLAWLHARAGDAYAAAQIRQQARHLPSGLSFAGRLEEIAILQSAIDADPADPRARYHLGNLLYDRRRYDEAIACWERAAVLDPEFPTTWRNLGIGYANVRGRGGPAERAYRRAFAADPTDGRVLYEWDQLEKRRGRSARGRLARLEVHRDLVVGRDDLAVELATLYNDLGRHADALAFLASRRFHPWEGGEGLVSGQYVRAHLRIAQAALRERRPAEARDHVAAAMRYPENLGEGKHLLTPEHDLYFHLGLALEALGDVPGALRALERAADPRTSHDPTTVPVPQLSEASYWRARALERLGDRDGAGRILRDLRAAARRQAREEVRIDYFATSLPTFLLFEDDLERRNRTACRYLEGLAELGLGRLTSAARAFEEVVALDPGHSGGRWGLREIQERAPATRRGQRHAGPVGNRRERPGSFVEPAGGAG
jgi:tetratricopeptide (TPR) repeat protein